MDLLAPGGIDRAGGRGGRRESSAGRGRGSKSGGGKVTPGRGRGAVNNGGEEAPPRLERFSTGFKKEIAGSPVLANKNWDEEAVKTLRKEEEARVEEKVQEAKSIEAEQVEEKKDAVEEEEKKEPVAAPPPPPPVVEEEAKKEPVAAPPPPPPVVEEEEKKEPIAAPPPPPPVVEEEEKKEPIAAPPPEEEKKEPVAAPPPPPPVEEEKELDVPPPKPSFEVDQNVEARFGEAGDWYAAKVLAIELSGDNIKYRVLYEESGSEKDVSDGMIRKVTEKPAEGTLDEGETEAVVQEKADDDDVDASSGDEGKSDNSEGDAKESVAENDVEEVSSDVAAPIPPVVEPEAVEDDLKALENLEAEIEEDVLVAEDLKTLETMEKELEEQQKGEPLESPSSRIDSEDTTTMTSVSTETTPANSPKGKTGFFSRERKGSIASLKSRTSRKRSNSEASMKRRGRTGTADPVSPHSHTEGDESSVDSVEGSVDLDPFTLGHEVEMEELPMEKAPLPVQENLFSSWGDSIIDEKHEVLSELGAKLQETVTEGVKVPEKTFPYNSLSIFPGGIYGWIYVRVFNVNLSVTNIKKCYPQIRVWVEEPRSFETAGRTVVMGRLFNKTASPKMFDDFVVQVKRDSQTLGIDLCIEQPQKTWRTIVKDPIYQFVKKGFIPRKTLQLNDLTIDVSFAFIPCNPRFSIFQPDRTIPFRIGLVRDAYYPGETVMGSLVWNVGGDPVNVIKTTLTATCCIEYLWFKPVHRTKFGVEPASERRTKAKTIFEQTIVLKEKEKLEPDFHVFPFEFELPTALPASLSNCMQCDYSDMVVCTGWIPIGYRLLYEISAKADVKKGINRWAVQEFNVYHPPSLTDLRPCLKVGGKAVKKSKLKKAQITVSGEIENGTLVLPGERDKNIQGSITLENHEKKTLKGASIKLWVVCYRRLVGVGKEGCDRYDGESKVQLPVEVEDIPGGTSKVVEFKFPHRIVAAVVAPEPSEKCKSLTTLRQRAFIKYYIDYETEAMKWEPKGALRYHNLLTSGTFQKNGESSGVRVEVMVMVGDLKLFALPLDVRTGCPLTHDPPKSILPFNINENKVKLGPEALRLVSKDLAPVYTLAAKMPHSIFQANDAMSLKGINTIVPIARDPKL